MKLGEILSGLGRPIIVYPELARLIGLKESIFLTQLLYWTGRQNDPDGWIYKTSDDIEAETGLTYEEQARLRKSLKAMNLLIERYRRLDHKMDYRVNADELETLWQDGQKGKALLPNKGKPISGARETHDRLLSESTTESTTHTPAPNGKLSEPKKQKRNLDDYSPEFETFWQSYPKKVNKGGAWDMWRKFKCHDELKKILTALEWQACLDDWTKENGRYVPDPERYLKKRRWQDEQTQEQGVFRIS